MPATPKVYVIVLNFRGADDTIGCLQSLDRSTFRGFEAIVVDNASGDDSLARIQAAVSSRVSYPLEFIQSPRNDGFATGNNIGLRAAMARGDGTHYWLLNNDTIVDSRALGALVEAAEADRSASLRIGQYGSKLLYASHPGVIQGVGNRYNRWFGVTQQIGDREVDRGQYNDAASVADLLNGASFFVRDDFVRDVGVLAEDYFLYFEEHDWAERGRRAGWGLRIVPASVVHHKQGVAIGAAGGDPARKSRLSDFYSIRSRLLFTAKFHWYCLPTVYLGLLWSVVLRITRGQWNRVPMIVRLMFTFRRAPDFPAF
ncbi:MAG: glycosyltransferase family 2 protein [Gemmatimonadaceae bacterium]